MTTSFDFDKLYRSDVPAPAAKWNGFPKHNFVGGHNAPESLDIPAMTAAMSRVLEREGPGLAMYRLYSGPLGYEPLRQFVAQKLKTYAGMTCSVDEILLGCGSSQMINLANDVLLAPGDAVVIEEATYGGFLSRFDRSGVDAVPIALDDKGMRADHLDRALGDLKARGQPVKYLSIVPTIQNPTATIMPLERRQEILRIAAAHDVLIFEDDCYANNIWSGERPPALYALDDDKRVIYCGSFSKSIAPALRVGYLVGPWEFLSRCLGVKTDAGSGALEQMLLAEYCPEHFDAHVKKLNNLLERKLDVLIEALDANFGTAAEFERPPGGIFLWIRLPEEVDTSRLVAVANTQSLAVNPGAEWSRGLADGTRRIRVCYASASEEEIRAGSPRRSVGRCMPRDVWRTASKWERTALNYRSSY